MGMRFRLNGMKWEVLVLGVIIRVRVLMRGWIPGREGDGGGEGWW